MALPVYLSNLRSSGVYTFEFDRSQIVTTTTSTIRLLIGFSKVGPFNTPVFCQDSAFFTQVFGPRDKQLEKKGSYFHLSALEMLREAPIIVLNLLNLDSTLDKTEFISFSTSATEVNQETGFAPLSGNFNTSKFWKLDTDKTLKNINNQEGYTKSLLNFVNVGRKTISVIVTQGNIQGLDITAKDWYGEADVPEFMDGSDLINDYCVRVNIIKGDYTDFETLSVDPILGDYFDTNGIKKTYTDTNGNEFDGLQALLENPNVIELGEYVGVLIPNFQDKEGNDLYIQDLVNLETAFTGLYCAVDEDLFDGSTLLSGDIIDLLGGTIEGDTTLTKINYLSYLGSVKESLSYDTVGYTDNEVAFITNTIDNIGNGSYGGTANSVVSLTDATAYGFTGMYDTLTIYSPSAAAGVTGLNSLNFADDTEWLAFAKSLEDNVSFVECKSIATGANPASAPTTNTTKALVKDVSLLSDRVTLQIHSKNESGTEDLYFNGYGLDLNTDLGLNVTPALQILAIDGGNYIFTATAEPGIDYKSGTLSSGDEVKVTGGGYETFTITNETASGLSGDGLDGLLSTDVLSHGIVYYTLDAQTAVVDDPMVIKSKSGDINKTFAGVTKINDYTFSYYVGATSSFNEGDIQPTDFLVRAFDSGATKTKIDPRTGKTRYTRIESVKQDTLTQIVTVKTIDPVYFDVTNDTVERYRSVHEFVTNYNVHGLDGFTMRDAQLPNGTALRQNEILGVLTNTGLFTALADKEAITFRYVVDSFEGLIEPNSKNVLSSLCKTRQFATAILNAPSVKQFDSSTNPLFKLNSAADYDPRYVPTGGNQDYNPSNTFSLPTLNQGSNYCGFYHPYLVLREGPSVKLVPPAAYVSNNYIAKYRTGQPYDIIAGPRRGVVAGSNIIGVEDIYDRRGLDYVEPMGLNVIVPTRGIGNVINANQTAQQNIKSALSSIHVRELLIYIEETVEQILKSYRWELNTVQTRLEIKTLVDGFLGRIQNDGGLYAFETVMNTLNNTPEVIDNDLGIIDIAVEPTRGLGKLVQRVTILRTGGIAAGEFTVG
jgi:uncharacterized protein YnzC (UPF0291/DUF896 family)